MQLRHIYFKVCNPSRRAFGSLLNKFQYQGSYSEYDDETGYDEFALRNYDPQRGQWTGVDPYDEFPSPYTGMGNDPVNNIDRSGGGIGDAIVDQLFTAGTGFVAGAIVGALTSKGAKDWLRDGLIGAGAALAYADVPWGKIGVGLGDAGRWIGNQFQLAFNSASLDNLFLTMDDAAINWAQKYNDNSIRERREYGSSIYTVNYRRKVRYTYSVPNAGGGGHVKISDPPNEIKAAADIHSHGASDNVPYSDNNFSNNDKWDNFNKNIPGYVSTPNGSLKNYDPKTGKIRIVQKSKLASDPKDPTRTNYISPYIMNPNEPVNDLDTKPLFTP